MDRATAFRMSACLHIPLSCDTATLLSVERRGFNAWPALHGLVLQGWLLRASEGYTKRANSANAMQMGAELAGLLPRIEDFYARQGLPAIFRLTPLAHGGADAELERAGYQAVDPSLLMRTALADTGGFRGATLAPDLQWRLDRRPDTTWMQGFAAAHELSSSQQAVHGRMLQSIAWPAAFASLLLQGQPIAWGLAVLEGDAVGLYDIAVLPGQRGRGLGRALVLGLLDWARRQGAHWADLQVREPNHVARRLYESLGFRSIYGYHYRVPAST
jgi:ribosomal protein S18 acetylase RimI-like enzyme